VRKVAHKVFDDIPMRVDSWWCPISQTIKKNSAKVYGGATQSGVGGAELKIVEQSSPKHHLIRGHNKDTMSSICYN
jgi:hypothetical protein